jgi:hypothetical protein
MTHLKDRVFLLALVQGEQLNPLHGIVFGDLASGCFLVRWGVVVVSVQKRLARRGGRRSC